MSQIFLTSSSGCLSNLSKPEKAVFVSSSVTALVSVILLGLGRTPLLPHSPLPTLVAGGGLLFSIALGSILVYKNSFSPSRNLAAKNFRETSAKFLKKAFELSHRDAKMEKKGLVLKGIWYGDPKVYEGKYVKELPDNDEFFTTNHGSLSSKFFNRDDKHSWCLKDGCSASEAIDSILQGPSRLECLNATIVYYYYAVKELIGSEKFDQLFGSIEGKPLLGRLVVSNKKPSQIFDFLYALKDQMLEKIDETALKPGDWAYFKGVEGYEERHKYQGNGTGTNVIYLGLNKDKERIYCGVDFDNPVTENEIFSKLIFLYRLEPLFEFSLKASTQKVACKVQGFCKEEVRRLDEALIKKIQENDVTEEFILQLKDNGYFSNSSKNLSTEEDSL